MLNADGFSFAGVPALLNAIAYLIGERQKKKFKLSAIHVRHQLRFRH
jgi:hypothetical protein